jgi:hypothetical protein
MPAAKKLDLLLFDSCLFVFIGGFIRGFSDAEER